MRSLMPFGTDAVRYEARFARDEDGARVGSLGDSAVRTSHEARVERDDVHHAAESELLLSALVPHRPIHRNAYRLLGTCAES